MTVKLFNNTVDLTVKLFNNTDVARVESDNAYAYTDSIPERTPTTPSTSRPAIVATVVTTPAAAPWRVAIHFVRLSQPVDAEALNTQVGTLAGVVALKIGLDDSATIEYDPQRTTCEPLAETVRSLGFSVRSYECVVQP